MHSQLPFNLPSSVWKGLIDVQQDLGDLEQTDVVTVQCLRTITEDSKDMGKRVLGNK
jgi:hypothetical protein